MNAAREAAWIAYLDATRDLQRYRDDPDLLAALRLAFEAGYDAGAGDCEGST